MHMTWTVVGLSVDAVVVFLFYKLYQNSAKAAQVVEVSYIACLFFVWNTCK